MATVWTVESHDLGGNSGRVVEAVFTSEEEARVYALEYSRRWFKMYPTDGEKWEDLFWIGTVELDPPDPWWGRGAEEPPALERT